MANYLDFLVAFDERSRQSSLGFLIYAYELCAIAQKGQALSRAGDLSLAR